VQGDTCVCPAGSVSSGVPPNFKCVRQAPNGADLPSEPRGPQPLGVPAQQPLIRPDPRVGGPSAPSGPRFEGSPSGPVVRQPSVPLLRPPTSGRTTGPSTPGRGFGPPTSGPSVRPGISAPTVRQPPAARRARPTVRQPPARRFAPPSRPGRAAPPSRRRGGRPV
jgi:hypothetical protein